MLDTNIILKMYASLSECALDEVKDKYLIIDDAAYYIEQMLSEDINLSKYSHVINLAAAKLAYYNTLLYKISSEGDTYEKAGDIAKRTSQSNSLAIAKQLKDDALISIMHLCKDEKFVFEAI